MHSDNEFYMCTPSDLSFSFQALLGFRNNHKDRLLRELDLKNDSILLLSIKLSFMLFKVFKTSQAVQCNLWVSTESDPEVWSSSEYFFD